MGKSILIYDDDQDILEICRYILEAKDYKVITKTNCRDVINDIRNNRPDIIIMDNWIPDMGGVQATQAIRKDPEFASIPVILFSANKDIRLLVEEAGADAFIEKPFNIPQLEQLVENTLKIEQGKN